VKTVLVTGVSGRITAAAVAADSDSVFFSDLSQLNCSSNAVDIQTAQVLVFLFNLGVQCFIITGGVNSPIAGYSRGITIFRLRCYNLSG